VLEKH
jgi:Fe-S-cluster formation regulator IscX/YfhJ